LVEAMRLRSSFRLGMGFQSCSVMPGLAPGIYVLPSGHAQDVDGRDIRAFTPVFAGYARP
jgi:hypothetical protein